MAYQSYIQYLFARKELAERLKRYSVFFILVLACISTTPHKKHVPPFGSPCINLTAASATTAASIPLMGSPAIKLEIHHININNGDASVIRIIHADRTETKVLIDGGQTSAATLLVPYCNAMFANNNFKYTILTHYHNDHYNGLMALGTGAITSQYYMDLGGYDMTNDVSQQNLHLIQPNDNTCPWTDSTGVFEGEGMPDYIRAVGTATDNFGMQRYMPFSKDVNHISDMIGVIIPVDTFMVGTAKVPIDLRCVAAWGFTQGNNAVVDNWNKGASKNDPSLGFVLECGEFRYFFGGDMGGQASGSYIDQETTLAEGFTFLYKGAKSYYKPAGTYDGHVCGFKANHHGSDHSNNSVFLGKMRPAVCVTSAGDNSGWHLPSIPFLQRLNATTPLTVAADIPSGPPFLKAQGFFFTNLFNFPKGNSLNEAKKLFDTRVKTAFQYGSKTGAIKAGYEVIINLATPNAIDYRTSSSFGVVSVDNHYKVSPLIAVLGCHKK